MSKFAFVIVSKDNDFKITEQQLSDNDNVVIYKISNNKYPLSKVYNSYLQKIRNDKYFDYLIFMHADVDLDIQHLTQHIEECKDKYDVMGLCGCAKMSVSQSPLNWWCASNPYPQFRWGCVTHGELGNTCSYFSKHSPNILDHEVACIDGLCIILTKTAIENNNLMFDENVNFNCYDTIFSLDVVLTHKMKLGVIVEQSLQHYSVGKSILTDDFLKDEKYMRQKFNFEVPQNSKLYHLIQENKI